MKNRLYLSFVLLTIMNWAHSQNDLGTQFTLLAIETDWIRTTFIDELNQPEDWNASGYDYLNGDHYVRLEIIEKPTDIEIMSHLCFWQGINEMCAPWGSLFNFSEEGTYYARVSRPYQDWSLREEQQGNRVKFFGEGKLTRVLLQWWIADPTGVKKWRVLRTAEQAGVKAGQREAVGDEALKHIPIRYKLEYIIVAKGEQFVVPGHWDDAPLSGAEEWNFYEK